MDSLKGLGKSGRERLSAILRATKGTVSVAQAADILGLDTTQAAKMLARWAKAGWMSRVRRGLYVPVSLESRTSDVPLEDPWIIAARLYAPCYIGGWSAAEYWDLTEQIFTTVVVLTTRKPKDRNPRIKQTDFLLRTVQENALFGLKPVWRGQVKVDVSDPTRTMLDMLSEPSLGGGIRPTTDMFRNYLKSEKKDLDLLIEYATRLGNGAVFKRLGFLLEKFSPTEEEAMARCAERLTAGNTRLDPALENDRLITRWHLWVPRRWVEE